MFESFVTAVYAILGFFDRWLWQPALQDAAYNPVDTTVYALIFALAAWLVYKQIFVRYKIKIDRNFMTAITGWAVTASALRVIEDIGLIENVWLRSPFIFFLIFAVAALSLAAARLLEKTRKIPYWKSWGVVSWSIAAFLIIMLPLKNWFGLLLIAAIAAGWLGFFIISARLARYRAPKSMFALLARHRAPKMRFFSLWNIFTLEAHMVDASASFVAVSFFSFWEKHVLGSALAFSFGPWALFAMKLIVLVPALWAIDRWCTKYEARYLKMIIFILGFAIGLRNTLAVAALG